METTEKKLIHTAAPWGWQRFGDTYSLTAQHGMREIIIGGIKHGQMGYPVVGMNLDGILQDVDPSHPNAKLIAAAPDMLKIIQEAEAWLSFNLNPDADQIRVYKMALREVIKKATE